MITKYAIPTVFRFVVEYGYINFKSHEYKTAKGCGRGLRRYLGLDAPDVAGPDTPPLYVV